MSIRHFCIYLYLTPVLFFAGCNPFAAQPAKFVIRDETKDLQSDVAKGVETELGDLFGTPQDLVAWQKLTTIDFGGYAGTTAASDEAGKVRSIAVEFDEDVLEKLKADYPADSNLFDFGSDGVTVTWTSGESYGETNVATEFDASAGTLALRETVEAPAAGTTFVLAGGQNLKYGRKLYMTHCMHCHGVSGDGNGPTAKYLNPLPRDYRQGVFKFKSTNGETKICRSDLKHTIRYGIPGTYMPSFLLLTDDELHAIIEYVRWLAIRGELEFTISTAELPLFYSKEAIEKRLEGENPEPEEDVQKEIEQQVADLPQLFYDWGDTLNSRWQEAESEDAVTIPAISRVEDTLESRLAGRRFFLEKCATCHGATGEGNGDKTMAFEKDPRDPEGGNYPEPGLHNVWHQPVQPRNLTQGIFRGGRRPVDLYRRLYNGITASKMPAFNTIPPETLWNTINYVRHIPFETEADKQAYLLVDEKYRAELTANPQQAAADGNATPPAEGEKQE